MKHKLCWLARGLIGVSILAVIIIGILVIMAFNEKTLAAEFMIGGF